jgi:isopenicillin-N N-acyltransferase-like protein
MRSHSADGTVSRRHFLSAVGSSVVVVASAKSTPVRQYPLIRVAGSHREMGRQHGEQAADKIKSFVETLAARGHYSRGQLRERALAFQPFFQKYCPHLLDEILGLAEGARIPLAEGLAVNVRDPLRLAEVHGCTSFVVGREGTSHHQILAGKNADMDPDIPPLGYVLHLKPPNKPEVLMWTFGGMIGYHGMNSAGVAEFDNALLGGGPAGRMGLPTYPMKRLMLECDHVDQIVNLYRTIPVAANCNYVVCDGHGNFLDLETTTQGVEVLRDDGRGFLAHANHYLSRDYLSTPASFPAQWKDSFDRQQRMEDLIHGRFGSLGLDDLQQYLRDHRGYPTSICRHAGSSLTVAAMISEPAERRMHVAFGNPCQNPFVTYSM